jgi:hypothetical protein
MYIMSPLSRAHWLAQIVEVLSDLLDFDVFDHFRGISYFFIFTFTSWKELGKSVNSDDKRYEYAYKTLI